MFLFNYNFFQFDGNMFASSCFINAIISSLNLIAVFYFRIRTFNEVYIISIGLSLQWLGSNRMIFCLWAAVIAITYILRYFFVLKTSKICFFFVYIFLFLFCLKKNLKFLKKYVNDNLHY